MRAFIFLFALVWALTQEKYNLPSNKDAVTYNLPSDKDVVIITREKCGYSKMMRSYLTNRNIDYEDINVTETGREILEELNLVGKTFPMVFLKKVYLGGYSDVINNPEFTSYIEKKSGSSNTKENSSLKVNLNL